MRLAKKRKTSLGLCACLSLSLCIVSAERCGKGLRPSLAALAPSLLLIVHCRQLFRYFYKIIVCVGSVVYALVSHVGCKVIYLV